MKELDFSSSIKCVIQSLINRAMGFPTEFFPVLFAIPRMAGYLAHWRESLDDPDTKIMRPQQVPS
jgi:citrate synthase